MYSGKKFKLGDTEYEIPALSLGQLRNGALEKIRVCDELAEQKKNWESIIARGELIHMALTRNYPNVPLDTVMDVLDLNNSAEIWLWILGASGFKPSPEEVAEKTAPAT